MVRTQAWREYNFGQVGNGRLFFYVGAGLSQAAGLVGWNEMAVAISRFRSEYEADQGDSAPKEDQARQNAAYLRRFVEEKDSEDEFILSRASQDDRTFARTVLLNFLLRYRRRDFSPGQRAVTELDLALHGAVWKTHCQGVFTTNYDMLLEEAFSLVVPSKRSDLYGHPAALRTYRYKAQFLPFILSVPRFVLKLHGDVDDIGTMLFDPETAWDQENKLGGHAGGDLRHVFDAALRSGHMIYVGCGGHDRTFRELHQWPKRSRQTPYHRLFFTPAAEVAGIVEEMGSAIDDLLFLTYGSPDDRPDRRFAASELHAFLYALTRCTKSRPHYFSNEATSLWNQLGGGGDLHRAWLTPHWDVSGVGLPETWNQGSPQVAGRYLWRRRDDHAQPFLATVGEQEDLWGSYLSVTLEGREIWWRYDQPWAINGRPPDEEFMSYEWAGPLDK